MSLLPENIPSASVAAMFGKHLGMAVDYSQWPPCYQSLADELESLIEIGAKWQKDSSLEKWFPFTEADLAAAQQEIKKLENRLNAMRTDFQDARLTDAQQRIAEAVKVLEEHQENGYAARHECDELGALYDGIKIALKILKGEK